MSEDKLRTLLEQMDMVAMNIESFLALVNGIAGSLRAAGVSEDLVSKLDNLSNALAEQRKEIEDIKARVEAIIGEVREALESEIKKRDTKIAELEKEVADRAAEISELKKTVGEYEAKIKSLEEEIRKKDQRIGGLEEELGKKEQELGELRKKIEEYEAETSSLKEELKKKTSEIESRDVEIGKLRAELSEAKKRIESLESDIRSKDAQIDDLRTQLESAKSELESVRKEMEEKISELNKAIEERNAEIADLRNKVSSLESDVEEKSKKLSEALELVKRYEKDVAAVEFARSLVATHPEAHILRALPVLLSIGTVSGEFVCVEPVKFTTHTKKSMGAVKSLLERVFKQDWYTYTTGIPSRLCIRKDILEAIRRIFEA